MASPKPRYETAADRIDALAGGGGKTRLPIPTQTFAAIARARKRNVPWAAILAALRAQGDLRFSSASALCAAWTKQRAAKNGDPE